MPTIEVRLEKDTVWLNQYQISELFQSERSVINKHINNIYKSGELKRNATCAKIAQVQIEGKRKISRKILYFNLDIIRKTTVTFYNSFRIHVLKNSRIIE